MRVGRGGDFLPRSREGLPEGVHSHEAGEMVVWRRASWEEEEAEATATQARHPRLALARAPERVSTATKRVKIKAPCADTAPGRGTVRGTRIQPLVFNRVSCDLRG